ncbi:MAG: hypothetical protein JJU28_08115 [Cyclobacteriaceae bacterium]|nr:hypothetical protein [Cyclobacteriaceae bacterium]
MRYISTLHLILALFSASVMLSCTSKNGNADILLKNEQLSLQFNRINGAFISLRKGKTNQQIARTSQMDHGSPWEIHLRDDNALIKLNIHDAATFSIPEQTPEKMVLRWSDFSAAGYQNLAVEAQIKMPKNEPVAYWDIHLKNTEGLFIEKLVYPIIPGLPDAGDKKLAIPEWMGTLIHNPAGYLEGPPVERKSIELIYPGVMSMQCMYLYNDQNYGFYAACNDAESYTKKFLFMLDTLQHLTYRMEHYPVYSDALSDYQPAYSAITGVLKGDWMDAALYYKEWAGQQEWCNNSRLTRHQTPAWLDSTALWIWNRGKSANVLQPAVHAKRALGLPVSVLWHWWHNGPYDVAFPEYFPPREGDASFKPQVHRASEEDVRAIVYMNKLQWGSSTQSWQEKGAERYAVRDREGKLRSHVYNIFMGKALTNMCVTTPFWKDTYSSLAARAVNEYGLGGIYMDQTCLSRLCYSTDHDHAPGGGNYWVQNSAQLIQQIRSSVPDKREVLLSGEGVGEAWLPHVDAFLSLQVSRERYTGISHRETIPFFQAVYHKHALTYGNYSSLLSPPYDELWPEENHPATTLDLLDTLFNRQFLMEQVRSYVWGMQPMISNFNPELLTSRKKEMDYLFRMAKIRSQHKQYLLYGEMLKSLDLTVPEAELDISRLSIYAGRDGQVTAFKRVFPLIYHGMWKRDNGNIGIALASIADTGFVFQRKLQSHDYALPASGSITVRNEQGILTENAFSDGIIDLNINIPAKAILFVEITGH